MSYRPITDVWILARPKVKYYGAYPNGFLERARVLLGANGSAPVLHLCAGHVRDYPNKWALGRVSTVDADPKTKPDFLVDLSDEEDVEVFVAQQAQGFQAVLIDPPYTLEDHAKYEASTVHEMPRPSPLLRIGLQLVPIGGRVGMLHYVWPQPPKTARSVALVAVAVGFNNRVRAFSVFERIA